MVNVPRVVSESLNKIIRYNTSYSVAPPPPVPHLFRSWCLCWWFSFRRVYLIVVLYFDTREHLNAYREKFEPVSAGR